MRIMRSLNGDVLEKIFSYLDFHSLIAAEMVCKQWKEVIDDRRLFWQLSKSICRGRAPKRKRDVPTGFDSTIFQKEKRKLKNLRALYPSRRMPE